MMPCPPMDATTSVAASAKKKMSRGAEKKPPSRSSSSSSSSSWVARSMGFYHHSSTSSKKTIAQPPPETVTVTETEGKNSSSSDKQSNSVGKKKRSISITCAGSSICSTKESSVMSRRDDHDRGRSASSRSLRAPDLDVVEAVYASAAAAISATSSFNSDTTTATAATTVTTTTTSSSSPLSSALSSPLSSFGTSSFRGGVPHIRKLSAGCYQCHSVFDPKTFSAATAFHCTDCDEVFNKAESLELHRATRHAVSELGPEDTSRNIVEIIFQSSWLRKQQQQAPVVCRIERILKVQSSERTVKRFEQYKESIRERARSDQLKKNPRCVADGNELLRFHCTTFTCSLGLAAGSTALCRSSECNLCSIVRDGFRVDGDGKIATMATSGRAHDTAAQVVSDSDVRAMLVCRVVAGRVKRRTSDDDKSSEDDDGDFDSVSTSTEGVYSDLDELFVFNPRAILPCFVVIYSGY